MANKLNLWATDMYVYLTSGNWIIIRLNTMTFIGGVKLIKDLKSNDDGSIRIKDIVDV